MLNKFQTLVQELLENNAAGAGGAFGTPQQAVYNPPTDISTKDSLATGDARNVMAGIFPLQKRKGKKKSKTKKPLVIKRNLQRKAL